jgi:hypothetical protein
MVGLGRVELPTNGLGNRCSIHLSYRPVNDDLIPGCSDLLKFRAQLSLAGLVDGPSSVAHQVYEKIFELCNVDLRLDARGM